jgi:RNase adaptor protein for sRNA GlmZ degradation
VDGIRHLSALQCLRTIVAPNPFRLVFFDAPDALLTSRLQSRGIESLDYLREFESHASEAEVQSVLRSQADLIIDGHLEVDEIVGKIVNHFA